MGRLTKEESLRRKKEKEELLLKEKNNVLNDNFSETVNKTIDTTNSIVLNCPNLNNQGKNPYCKTSYSTLYLTREDVYDIVKYDKESKQDETFYGLRKNILMQISDRAGIRWENDCQILKFEPNCVIYKAVASFRNQDGYFTQYSAVKELNISLEEESLYKRFLELGKKFKNSILEEEKEILGDMSIDEWAKAQTKMQIFTIKKNKLAVAETGAKLRLIRNALNIPNYFTLEDIKKPIIITRIDFVPDFTDDDVKKMYLMAGFNSALYQQSASTQEPLLYPSQINNKVDFGKENKYEENNEF